MRSDARASGGPALEYPLIRHAEDAEWGAHVGQLSSGMIVCRESHIGEAGGSERIRIEEPAPIGDGPPRILSSYLPEDRFA